MEKQVFWLHLIIGAFIFIFALVTLVMAFDAAENSNHLQRDKVKACKTITHEGLQAVCIEHS